jgi:hypothetical protein
MFDLIRNAFNKTEVNSEQEKRKSRFTILICADC